MEVIINLLKRSYFSLLFRMSKDTSTCANPTCNRMTLQVGTHRNDVTALSFAASRMSCVRYFCDKKGTKSSVCTINLNTSNDTFLLAIPFLLQSILKRAVICQSRHLLHKQRFYNFIRLNTCLSSLLVQTEI